ncbi:MAG: UDP-N-acetylmuramoyl-L-alanyl-D-glutamate--2,6-diaminopimelate ligase [Clostridiales Family XIII bacterium]|jgi:UDP-N-acetylmuramyl-tripeptide synthetase|nr:UDP-N-acetylmuramoyl-L-alanyl-D-glutamate--2,6-diaminopimelate ligase [Clostridiales Family XIII bacterium]
MKATKNAYRSLRACAGLLREKGLLVRVSPATAEDRAIESLCYDSREARAGALFLCKGARFSAEYLTRALAAGARAYVSEIEYAGVPAPALIVSDIRAALAVLANGYYGEIWRALKLAGVTGTKGKSTTVSYLKAILDDMQAARHGMPAAILSGIENYDGVIREESHLTTPETLELHRHFQNAVESGMEYMVMEVSSQALKYDRTLGLRFDAACFLNIGEDHISDIEHADFEDYFSSKLKIFRQCDAVCVNADAAEAARIAKAAKACPRVLRFGFSEGADLRAVDIRPSGTGFAFRTESRTAALSGVDFEIGMPGYFNMENALAAIALAHFLRVPVPYIRAGLAAARVAGRMELFRGADGRIVIVDYAHNKLSFETLFKSVRRAYAGRRIGIVFGCPGGKALGRRRELGVLAGEHADFIYLTEEDAGEEDALDICREIAAHAAPFGRPCRIVPDREEAIRAALAEADARTVLLITGKGRETRQKRGRVYVDTPSDVAYVERYLDSPASYSSSSEQSSASSASSSKGYTEASSG